MDRPMSRGFLRQCKPRLVCTAGSCLLARFLPPLAVLPGGAAHTAGGLLRFSAAPSHPQFLCASLPSFPSLLYIYLDSLGHRGYPATIAIYIVLVGVCLL